MRRPPAPFLEGTSARRVAGLALQAVPEELGGYAEPFLDAGATAVAVLSARPSVSATLTSSDERVVEVWQLVRDDVESLIRELRMLAERHSPPFFAGVRDRDLAPHAASSLSPAERAARYVYLRGTARPDPSGDPPRDVADVVHGRDRVPVDEAGLRALGALLGSRDVTIAVRTPFELLGALREDELLWLDPSDALRTTAGGPGARLDRELRSLVGSAVARGAAVLAPEHPLLAEARDLAPVLSPAADVTLLGSAALRRSLRAGDR